MQISPNNISPPVPGLGLGGEARGKSDSGPVSEFRSLVANPKARVDRPIAKTATRPALPKKSSPSTGTEKSVASGREGNPSDEVGDNAEIAPVRPRMGKGKEVNPKSVAIRKFMDSLEGELGISAERFSAALAQLPEDQKALSVEESAPYVIQQLGVPENLQPKYAETYVDLWQESGLTADKPLSSLTQGAEPMVNTVASKAAEAKSTQPTIELQMSSKANSRQKINANIDEMNKRFFNVATDKGLAQLPPESLPQEGVMLPKDSQAEATRSARDQWASVEPQQARQIVPVDMTVKNGYMPTPSMNTGNAVVEANSLESLQSLEEPLSYSLADLEKLAAQFGDIENLDVEAYSEPGAGAKLSRLDSQRRWTVEELPFLAANENGSPITERAVSQAGEAGIFNSLGKNLKDTETGETSERTDVLPGTEDAFYSSAQWNDSRTSVNGSQGKAPPILNNAVSQQDRIENLSKLSVATESLAAKGGGEVKVVLAPEGFGSVHLKVRMQEGKVQVEMKAENSESQKLLENSLQELRQSLSSHRLTVDSVKVDVGGDLARQETSQSFSQPQFDMGREQARQFMNLFREGNFSQRQGFFDSPGMKTYRSKKEEPLQRISQDVRPRASLTEGKGRELNLVA